MLQKSVFKFTEFRLILKNIQQKKKTEKHKEPQMWVKNWGLLAGCFNRKIQAKSM